MKASYQNYMRWLFTGVILIVGLVGAAPVFGEQSGVAPATLETTIHGGALVLIAYIVLWGLVFGYIFLMTRRQRALNRDFAALEDKLDRAVSEVVSASGD